MIVYYRLCSIPSTNPSPILQEDKFELNKLCLKSFVKTFKDLKPTVVFLADFCGQRENDMVDQLMAGSGMEYSFIPTNIGINETALMQWEMASQQSEEVILFLECDYLWAPDVDVTKLVEAIKTLGLVSPYDHINFYKEQYRNLHSKQCEIELVADHHFRSTERNTLTFGIRKDVLLKNLDIFNKYGYLDGETWYEIKDRGQNLYVPIPSMATHMVVDNLAPGFDWSALYGQSKP